MDFVRSELNLSNPLTKPLNRKLVEQTLRGSDGAFAYCRFQRLSVTQPVRMGIP